MAWLWCVPLPLGLRRPPPPAPVPVEALAPLGPVGMVVEVNGRGKGDGNSSTLSECGLSKGPVVMGNPLIVPAPLGAEAGAPKGVGGGDVPILFRNFRVIWGRD